MKNLKVIVAGGRDFNDYQLLGIEINKFLHSLLGSNTNLWDVEIVCGKANGADVLGAQYGKNMGYSIKYFPANWSIYGKSAGYRRNEQMADYADACICFWDRKSKGTKHMIDLARQYELTLNIINYKEPKQALPHDYAPLCPNQ